MFGLILMVALEVKKVRGSILIGVLVMTAIGLGAGPRVHWTSTAHRHPAISSPDTLFQLDIRGALSAEGLLEIIFVFFFVDLFDNLGTLVAVTKRAGLIARRSLHPAAQPHPVRRRHLHHLRLARRHLTVTSYVESTAGVAAGGRTGVTAIVTGLLFLVAMVAAPFVGSCRRRPPRRR